MALWPQFLFMSGMINNDNLLTFLLTLSVYLVLRQQRDGPSYRSAIVLGLALGAALLAKGSAVLLALPTGAAMLLDRRAWRFIPVTLAVVFVVAGWWYIRNMVLYGELSGLATMVEISDGYFKPGGVIDLRAGLPRMADVYATFWARLGNNLEYVPGFVLRVFDVLVILSLTGLLLRFALILSGKRAWPDLLQRKQAAVIGLLLILWLFECLLLPVGCYGAIKGAICCRALLGGRF
jgi:4-amino-4-deoxy-L-arabinose transferase-like glycosyltransferase